ncbi:MAG: hypothetical protein WCO23_01005 [bacterium]
MSKGTIIVLAIILIAAITFLATRNGQRNGNVQLAVETFHNEYQSSMMPSGMSFLEIRGQAWLINGSNADFSFDKVSLIYLSGENTICKTTIVSNNDSTMSTYYSIDGESVVPKEMKRITLHGGEKMLLHLGTANCNYAVAKDRKVVISFLSAETQIGQFTIPIPDKLEDQ